MKTLAGIALSIALASCTHADGTPLTAREIYKLGRDGALATCAVESAVATALVTVDGSQLPALIAQAICAVIRAFPDAIGVVATRDGHAEPLGISSGGTNGEAESR